LGFSYIRISESIALLEKLGVKEVAAAYDTLGLMRRDQGNGVRRCDRLPNVVERFLAMRQYSWNHKSISANAVNTSPAFGKLRIRIISPPLHYHSALLQILCMITGGGHAAAIPVG
jgi:hypothetical protein